MRLPQQANHGTARDSRVLVKKRILFLLAGACLALASCSESQVYPNLVRALGYAVNGLPDTPVDRSAIANSPYAFIAGKIGRGPRSVLVLWREENDDLHWLSADNVAIVTRFGRVVKTAGLPQELASTEFLGTDPIIAVARSGDPSTVERLMDFRRGNRLTSTTVTSTLTALGVEHISIDGLTFETRVVREDNNAIGSSWSFTNYYWVDPVDPIVWRSVQHVSKTFPPLTLEMLKPAG